MEHFQPSVEETTIDEMQLLLLLRVAETGSMTWAARPTHPTPAAFDAAAHERDDGAYAGLKTPKAASSTGLHRREGAAHG